MDLPSMRRAPIKKGTRVLVRADFDIPVEKGKILEDYRIQAVLPTLRYLIKKGALVRIISHRGRPDGKKNNTFSLQPIADYVSRELGRTIIFIKDPLSKKVFEEYSSSGEILMFENIRFWPGEETDDPAFAAELASWGDVYINEAFAVAHRKHCSVDALPRRMSAFAGLRLEEEVSVLEGIFTRTKHPFAAVLGGAKLETKVPLIKRFVKEADYVLIGGAIANTLLVARGVKVGKSVIDRDDIAGASAWSKSKKISLPADVAVAKTMSKNAKAAIKKTDNIAKDEYVLDIGPDTIAMFGEILRKAKMIVWNGPMGYTENPQFARGTAELLKIIKPFKSYKVVGGGDTVAVLHALGGLHEFSYVSTGGGAMLELLSGKKLPGLEALKKSRK